MKSSKREKEQGGPKFVLNHVVLLIRCLFFFHHPPPTSSRPLLKFRNYCLQKLSRSFLNLGRRFKHVHPILNYSLHSTRAPLIRDQRCMMACPRPRLGTAVPALPVSLTTAAQHWSRAEDAHYGGLTPAKEAFCQGQGLGPSPGLSVRENQGWKAKRCLCSRCNSHVVQPPM